MRPDSLARLIEAAEPDQLRQLRQLARLVLRLTGYADSRITDGSYDGGVDLRILAVDGSELPEGVAVSVEQKWQPKLRGDAARAKAKLGLSRLRFISSRRIPETSFRPVQRDVHDKLGVHVDRSEETVGMTTEFAGLWTGEREAEKSAQILDTLVKLEREEMSHAEIVQKVQEFRDRYLAEHGDVADVSALERAWLRFRGVSAAPEG